MSSPLLLHAIVAAVFVGTAAMPSAAAADAFSSDWRPALKAQTRLIAGDSGDVGVEIKLAPGAITYWRDPGDAGAPPVFDFSGSINVKSAMARLPAPKRIPESDGGEAFGYDGDVVMPIDVTRADPSKPATLALNLNYAVCEKICVPAQAKLSLMLSAAKGSPYAARLAEARRDVPKPIAASTIAVDPIDAGSWRACAVKTAAPRDLFVESPEGYWIAVVPSESAGERGNCFKLTLKQKPEGATFPLAVRLTFTGGDGPVETEIGLTPKL